MFPIPVLRYMKTYGITHEQMADGRRGAARVGREESARHHEGRRSRSTTC